VIFLVGERHSGRAVLVRRFAYEAAKREGVLVVGGSFATGAYEPWPADQAGVGKHLDRTKKALDSALTVGGAVTGVATLVPPAPLDLLRLETAGRPLRA
jgi:hypothetical protein